MEPEALAAMLKFEGVSRTELCERIVRLAAALRERHDASEAARQRMLIEGCLTCVGARDYRAMLANLTSAQARGTELLTENRAMRMAAASLCSPEEWAAAVYKALVALGGKP